MTSPLWCALEMFLKFLCISGVLPNGVISCLLHCYKTRLAPGPKDSSTYQPVSGVSAVTSGVQLHRGSTRPCRWHVRCTYTYMYTHCVRKTSYLHISRTNLGLKESLGKGSATDLWRVFWSAGGTSFPPVCNTPLKFGCNFDDSWSQDKPAEKSSFVL